MTLTLKWVHATWDGILSVILLHQLPNEMKLQLQPDRIICRHFQDKKAKIKTTLFWDALSLWGHPHQGTSPALQLEYFKNTTLVSSASCNPFWNSESFQL